MKRATQRAAIPTTNHFNATMINLSPTIDVTTDVTTESKTPMPITYRTEGISDWRLIPSVPTTATAAKHAIAPKSNAAAWGLVFTKSFTTCHGFIDHPPPINLAKLDLPKQRRKTVAAENAIPCTTAPL